MQGEAGEAARFISRSRAVRKLQLGLQAFNRVCIIKGIFPIEPKNRIKAQKGDSKYRPLYLKKDIKFLMHDPLIWTIRQEEALRKKLAKARHLRDGYKEQLVKRNKPIYRLEQNVLERYPTFVDAVKDLGDPLTMIFLFCNIEVRPPIYEHHVSRCQRLKIEFLTYVIEASCLTKAFITTKGYYYEVPPNADMKIMRHFLEFYIAMLGFVNFRLLGKVDLRYPLKPKVMPRLKGAEKKDLDNLKNLMASLNYPLEKTTEESEENLDDNETTSKLIKGSSEKTQKVYAERMQAEARRKLFSGLKFFLNPECNRESLTLVIRSCGGEVSWPSTVFPCSTYKEDDQCITHQIVDRPNFDKKYLTRFYVQPQWVYDCLNAVTLKPCQPYLPGCPLPPHICPFLKNFEGWYIPPEEEDLRKLLAASPEEKEALLKEMAAAEQKKLAMLRAVNEKSDDESGSEDDDDEDKYDEDENDESDEEKDEEVEEDGDDAVNEADASMEVDDGEGNNKEEEKKDDGKEEEIKDVVRRGKERFYSKKKDESKEERTDTRMRTLMIHKKNRKLYHKLKTKETKRLRRSSMLKDRREALELHKIGKISDEQLEGPPKTKIKQTFSERRAKLYQSRVRSAVRFARSAANKNRFRGEKKKPAIADTRDE
ncbi:hypothetical protein HAZT_HAZT001717 [Hyalella azteca]|uniref:Pescadillo homolog n=1 Tax=Hyalella azteca TaxID=294128 RepID=A0A6A0H0I3_HYAAZ|nr:hypothetical protein HAZT_HAZT001717 [Hyalella azteca]